MIDKDNNLELGGFELESDYFLKIKYTANIKKTKPTA